MKMKKTEEDEQSALFEYAGLQKEPEWKMMFSIPNGGFRSKKTGARMKKTGTMPGVPDLQICVARGNFHGLFIELKSEKGRVQPNQAEWHKLPRAQGYQVEGLQRLFAGCASDQGIP